MTKEEFNKALKSLDLDKYRPDILENLANRISRDDKDNKNLEKIKDFCDAESSISNGALISMISAYKFSEDGSKEIGKWLIELCGEEEYSLADLFEKIFNLQMTKEEFNKALESLNLKARKWDVIKILKNNNWYENDEKKRSEGVKKIDEFSKE